VPFQQVVSSAIIDKYIGESARLIREMFNYAREHQVNFVPFLSVPITILILSFVLGIMSETLWQSFPAHFPSHP
jgi:hypothetical protein